MTGKGDMTVVCGSCWRSCHRTSFQGAAAGHGTLSTFLDSTWLFFLFFLDLTLRNFAAKLYLWLGSLFSGFDLTCGRGGNFFFFFN